MIVPVTFVPQLGTCPFFDIIAKGLIKEVMIVIKLNCELAIKADYQALEEKEVMTGTTAIHIASNTSHMNILDLLMET